MTLGAGEGAGVAVGGKVEGAALAVGADDGLAMTQQQMRPTSSLSLTASQWKSESSAAVGVQKEFEFAKSGAAAQVHHSAGDY